LSDKIFKAFNFQLFFVRQSLKKVSFKPCATTVSAVGQRERRFVRQNAEKTAFVPEKTRAPAVGQEGGGKMK
jgi:hypothetical protein